MTPSEIFDEASWAAYEAAQSVIAANPNQFYPCGFAWVTIKPARGKFVSMLKEMKIGRLGTFGGYSIWNPSNCASQWMDPKFVGAVAFANVLNKYGINATAEQRID